ncbi:hypothetical protein [Gandjariella thermophila]|uniref:Uncharacterized protein n=1 Tax=Gandjariella thermophila TaxID=1931992 RepID=A0A4D4JF21_9PSEU|nr:hypothetical protein [Gandjariella thermophila]GDY34012.1 hypothetical protein GTS_56450 [Gandjariella thermophila]
MPRAYGIVPERIPTHNTEVVVAASPSQAGYPIDPYAAVAEYPVLEPLLALCERADSGWVFRHKRGRSGEVTAIQGVRIVEGSHLDVVRIISHERVVVARAWLVGERAGEFMLNIEGRPEKVIPILVSLPDRES